MFGVDQQLVECEVGQIIEGRCFEKGRKRAVLRHHPTEHQATKTPKVRGVDESLKEHFVEPVVREIQVGECEVPHRI